jgi:hypothetical protein
MKFDYNKDLREYNIITKQIQNEENNLEEIDRKIAKIKFKQNIRLSMINTDFINHFNEYMSNLKNEIVDSFLEFLNLNNTPYIIIKVIIII